jgi:hypothetical protein
MIRRATRPIGGEPHPMQAQPEILTGSTAAGQRIAVVRGGHRFRRAEGLSFSDPALLRELRDDLDVLLREWPA